jgi:PAS domain S-box-containing protein
LPGYSNQKTIQTFEKFNNQIPIIVLSGETDRKIALSSIQNGMQDYIVKDQLNKDLFYKTIKYSMERFKFLQEITDQEDKYRILFENIHDPIFIFEISKSNPICSIAEINNAAFKKFDYNLEELSKLSIEEVFQKDLFTEEFIIELNLKGSNSIETSIRSKNNKIFEILLNSRIFNLKGKQYILSIAIDITERKKLEKIFEFEHNLMSLLKKIKEIKIQTQTNT